MNKNCIKVKQTKNQAHGENHRIMMMLPEKNTHTHTLKTLEEEAYLRG